MTTKRRLLTLVIAVTMLFTMYSGSAIVNSSTTPRFVDVSSNHWAYTAIDVLAEKGIITGSDPAHFKPAKNVTRAEFVKMMVFALDLPIQTYGYEYYDVNDTAWYANYIETAVQNNLASGTSMGTFDPDMKITREQMAVILMKSYSKLTNQKPDSNSNLPFIDTTKISSYALDSVKAAYAKGYISGMAGNTFAPKASVTRAQAASVIYKMMNSVNWGNPTPTVTPKPPPSLPPISIDAGTIYYIDAVNGHDDLDGKTIGTAWKTLGKVNSTSFQPGDHILFSRGQTWSGYLNPSGSGVAGSPIVIDAYGTGDKPKINMGENWEGIMLYNQEYWEINNMEVYSNYWGEKNRYGIYIGAGTPNTTYHHFKISNCVVHDIGNGLSNISNVAPGYAAIGVNFKTARNSSTAVSNLKVDDVMVDSCQVYNTRVGAGIFINGRDDTDDSNTPMKVAFPFFSTNATIQNCSANDTKGIPIELTGFTGATIQNNVAFSPSLNGSECIMTVGVNNAVIQGNETYNDRWDAYADGGGIDADHFSTNVILQYNYCHDNNAYGMGTLS
jgi:hypothetical protein